MIDEDISNQIKEEVSAIEEVKVLLGLMKEPQAKRWMELDYSARNRWGPHLDQEKKAEIREEKGEEWDEKYSEATSGLESPPPFQDSQITTQELPDDDGIQEYVDGFIESEPFQDAYGDMGEGWWDIKLVPIESLVAYQSHVTTTAHQEIPTRDDGLLEVLKYCLPYDVRNYLMVDSEQNGAKSVFARIVSRNPNVNIGDISISEIDDRPPGNVSVTIDIKPRPNFVQVAKFNDRYILKNGYHRSYQLLQSGEDYIPAVVQYAQDFTQTGAANAGWFSPQNIMGERPPLVADFTTEVAADLEVKSTNKMVNIQARKINSER